jgi:hypothetical protein
MMIRMRLMIATAAVFLLLQLVRHSVPTKTASAGVHAPIQIRAILAKDCYTCHSDNVDLRGLIKSFPGTGLCGSISSQRANTSSFRRLARNPQPFRRQLCMRRSI